MTRGNLNSKIIIFLILSLTSCSNGNRLDIGNWQTRDSRIVGIDSNVMFLDTIYFDFDSIELSGESKLNLNLLASYLMDSNNESIILTGHCDEIGSDIYNHRLGLARAREAKNYLASLGIDESRIAIVSRGKTDSRKVVIDFR